MLYTELWQKAVRPANREALLKPLLKALLQGHYEAAEVRDAAFDLGKDLMSFSHAVADAYGLAKRLS